MDSISGLKEWNFSFKNCQNQTFPYFKTYSYFRHYIPQNLLLTVKNSVNHCFWMAGKEEMFI